MQQPDSTEKQLSLTFRAGPEIAPETLDMLDRYTEPKLVTAEPREPLEKILRRVYGDFAPNMASRVRAANPSFPETGSEAPVTLRMPAGPYLVRNVEANLIKGESLSAFAELLTGTFNTEAIERINNLPAGAACQPFAEGKKIKLPFVSRHVSFELKPGLAENIKAIEEVLSSRPGISEVRAGKPLMIVPVGMLAADGTCGGKKPAHEKWYEETLRLSEADAQRFLKERQRRVTVAFLDTGLGVCNTDEGTVPDTRFKYWLNRLERILDTGEDDDGDSYYNNEYGVDVTASGLETDPFNFQNPRRDVDKDSDCQVTVNAMHGTHVAGILSGSLLTGDLRDAVIGRIRLLPIKITDEERALNSAAVGRAMTFLRYQMSRKSNRSEPVNVVNLSFADAYSGSEPYNELMEKMRDTLFVAAAGNVNKGLFGGKQVNLDDLDGTLFPAMLPIKHPNAITVAALRENGRLADFSYFGVNVVDLAAPGENILSTVRDFDNPNDPKATGFASGTSQAAPFVSMTAALLFLMGFTDADLVRRRIICSTDFRPQLKDFVWSSGSLNVTKALDVYDDIIDLKPINGVRQQPIKGLLSRPLNIRVTLPPEGNASAQELTFPIEQVRKIIPEYETDANGMWSAIIVSTEGLDETFNPVRKLRFIKCKLELGTKLEIVKDLGDKLDDKTTSVAWSDVAEITICDPPDGVFLRKERVQRVGRSVVDESEVSKLNFVKVPKKDIR